jgi:hypothetical protein
MQTVGRNGSRLRSMLDAYKLDKNVKNSIFKPKYLKYPEQSSSYSK